MKVEIQYVNSSDTYKHNCKTLVINFQQISISGLEHNRKMKFSMYLI